MNFINRIIKSFRKDIVLGAIGSLFATLLLYLVTKFRDNISLLSPVVNYIASELAFFIIIFLLVFIIVIALIINSKLENDKQPEIKFGNPITLRRIYHGSRSLDIAKSYALSVRVGVVNKVKLFNTEMTLCFVRFKEKSSSNNIDKQSFERHGVEEYYAKAAYVEFLHRFSFYSEEMSYLLLKAILDPKGYSNYDKLIVVFTGFYGKKADKKFVCQHEYLLSETKFFLK
ncbi:MAG: hypothetical protein AAFQ91_28555 [Cyanobacteria bacterium J06621_15]